MITVLSSGIARLGIETPSNPIALPRTVLDALELLGSP
jgi:hypothetical protein